jgi:hypothetical protein
MPIWGLPAMICVPPSGPIGCCIIGGRAGRAERKGRVLIHISVDNFFRASRSAVAD